MRYFFIVNPIAGHGNHFSLLQKIEAAFHTRLTDQYACIETKRAGHACEIAEELATQHGANAVVVACGGDGTVHEVANGLAYSQTPMLVLPFGTGNDFAKKLYGLQFSPEQIADQCGLLSDTVQYEICPIDLIKVNDTFCINIMSFGFDTMVERLGKRITNFFPPLRTHCYTLAVVLCLFFPKRFELSFSLQLDGAEQLHTSLPFTLAAICNASYYGGGFCPAPQSKLDDGVLDLFYVEPVSSAWIIGKVSAYRQGLLQHSKTHTSSITSGIIATLDGSPLPINCDGEHLSCSKVQFEVQKHALHLFLPKS